MTALPRVPDPVFRRSFAAIGTICHVLATDERALEAAAAITKAELVELDRACSRFRPDSELSALEQGHTVTLSPLLTELLAAALRTARRTDGLVDPTVGGILRDLGYDDDLAVVRARRDLRRGTGRAPVQPAPGYWRIMLDERRRQAVIPRGVHVDLGASAKAWAADHAAASCAAALPGGFLVNLGGDLAVSGEAPPQGWQVALDDATSPDAADWPVVSVSSGGLATSSTAVRTWRQGDDELHHIVDPRTGEVAEPLWRAVTVVARTAELANAAATASIVLGRAAPRWLALRGLPARLVSRDGLPVFVGEWPDEAPWRRSA
jgi:thiamine biosynthesis lipoprotein